MFKEDAGKIPVQIRANAPILDATKNIEQIKQITGRAGWGTNNPNRGKYGTVYVASEVYTSQESYAGLAIAGAFVHELGNILDAKIFPTDQDGKYESHHGNKDSKWDIDTGAAFQLCVFGTIWTPSGPRNDMK